MRAVGTDCAAMGPYDRIYLRMDLIMSKTDLQPYEDKSHIWWESLSLADDKDINHENVSDGIWYYLIKRARWHMKIIDRTKRGMYMNYRNIVIRESIHVVNLYKLSRSMESDGLLRKSSVLDELRDLAKLCSMYINRGISNV